MTPKVVQNVQDYVERIRSTPREELNRWARFARFQVQLWRYCARRLWHNNVTAMSAALSFRTIFAMVPILVLSVLVLKSLGVLEDNRESLRRFLAGSGFAQITIEETHPPEPTEVSEADTPSEARVRTINVADEIERLVADVEAKLTFRRIGPIGVALLIWTALTLITTAERSLNRIFEARRARSLGRRLLLYWAVLTLGPLALAIVVYTGRRAAQTIEQQSLLSWMLWFAVWAGPIVTGILVVGAVYALLPNTRVRYRHALGGALVSVPIWLVAKWAFGLYVTEIVAAGSLYGALGLLPLFLLWLNLSWWVFLFGAQLAHTASNLHAMQSGDTRRRSVTPVGDLLAAALAVMIPFQQGAGPTTADRVARALGCSTQDAALLLARLTRLGVLCPVRRKKTAAYVPARPSDRITLLDLLALGQQRSDLNDGELARAVRDVQASLESRLGDYTLADAIPDDKPTRGPAGSRPE